MPSPQAFILNLYFTILVCLSLYGVHRSYLVYLYIKGRKQAATHTAAFGSLASPDQVPTVTVQLPIYNEMYVVERLIDAVARLRYPRARFQVQVLDDSTDETQRIAKRAVSRWRARGVEVCYFHRAVRTGFKAGALREGLRTARGELIAIFDADFIPPVDFLERVVAAFNDPSVGMVQARWGHVNRDCSLLTRVQALLLDAHFVLEHGARHRAGCFFNFNGTAGVWRRRAIVSAGGWQHDTLTEDLDLSYRAQLAGWRFVFLPDLVVPAEVPVEMNAFKLQQHRWAKGSIQTCLKVLPAVLRADLPLRVKAEAFFHLTANFNYLLMLALALLMVPALYVRGATSRPQFMLADFLLFSVATLSVVNFYALSQWELRGNWLTRLRDVPALIAVSIGLSVNNARAVVEAMVGGSGEFVRTPKYGVMARHDGWMGKSYRQVAVVQPLVELGFGIYYTTALFYALSDGLLVPIPFLVLSQIGFLYAGLLSLMQQHAAPGAGLRARVTRG